MLLISLFRKRKSSSGMTPVKNIEKIALGSKAVRRLISCLFTNVVNF